MTTPRGLNSFDALCKLRPDTKLFFLLRLDTRKLFFSELVKRWHRLPRVVVESPSVEVFKNQGDVARRGMGEWAWWGLVDGWTRWSFPALMIP